jgi:polyisoprenyl-phosphate glycosyltransferase
MLISIITPAFNEEKNLPDFFVILKEIFAPQNILWEWIIIDDGSSDNTFLAGRDIALANSSVSIYKLSRNFGSHLAISCGLNKAKGDVAVVLAADLQDPPVVILKMLDKWKEGIEIVWAVRETHTTLFSKLYYWLVRKMDGLKNLPSTGADFFLIDRKIIDIFLKFNEPNNSIFALLTWMGFKQAQIQYVKGQRKKGKSGWNLAKKIKLTVDSIISYSYAPIRAFSLIGFITTSASLLYAVLLFVKAIMGDAPVLGWTTLMIIMLVLSGIQMMMLGVLGEYLWRTLDQSRNRPPFLIEAEFSRELENKMRGTIPDLPAEKNNNL